MSNQNKPSGLWHRLMDYWTSYAAGYLGVLLYIALGIGLIAAAWLAVLIIGLIALSGVLPYLLVIGLIAIPVAIWIHQGQTPATPPQAPIRQRQSGVYGDAGYATFDHVSQLGLIGTPESFKAGVYLGPFLNWYTPIDQPWELTNWHMAYAGENNVLTVAPAGSGKFTTTIASTLIVSDESMAILDVKGESFAVTSRHRAAMGHEIVAINPFNMFGELLGLSGQLTARFNPLSGLQPDDENFTTQIDALAAAMIVQEGSDPHWPNRARDLVACLMAHVCSDPEERAAGNNKLPRVRQILGLPRAEFAAYMALAAANPIPRVANLAAGFSDPTSKEISSIISTAIGQLSFLDQPMLSEFLSESTFDFADLRRKRMTIYIMLPPNEMNTYYRFARLLVQACMNALSVEPKPEDRRVLLLLDEQAQLKHMETVVQAIALLRGYRVRIWSVFQDLNQMQDIYGARWESFVSNAGVVQVFTTNDEKTAKYFSNKAGNTTGVVVSESTSSSVSRSSGSGPNSHGSTSSSTSTNTSTNLAAIPLLSPQDFYKLPNWQSVLFIRGTSDVVPGFKRPYWEEPGFANCYLPNPFRDPEGFKQAFLAGRALDEARAEGRAISYLPAPQKETV